MVLFQYLHITMAESIKWVEETDQELPLDRQVPHSGYWEDEGEVRHKYAV